MLSFLQDSDDSDLRAGDLLDHRAGQRRPALLHLLRDPVDSHVRGNVPPPRLHHQLQ